MIQVFNIDYKRLVVMLLPPFMRLPLLFGIIKAIIRPVITAYDTFMTNRSQNIYRVTRTGQVCHLRGMLNDAFDSALRRIYIADGQAGGWVFLYQQALFNVVDNKHPLIVTQSDAVIVDALGNTTVIFNEGLTLIPKQGSIGASGIDFLVMVPFALRGAVDENRIKSQVNYYKLASKRYEIQYY